MGHSFTRRDFIKTVGWGAAAFSLPACYKKSNPPNLVFIMSDDHAAQAISCYGSKINQTPHIDRIAREGIRFDHCFCTNGICAPSRAVILTGKHSHRNGVIDNSVIFDNKQVTFPKLLQQAGYQTAMVGKWHLKSDPTGFDYWNVLPDQGSYYNPDFNEMGQLKRSEGYCTDIITDICLEWLGRRDPLKPFCLLYHHKAPHRNWMPGPDQLTKYEDRDIPEPSNLFDDYKTRSAAAREQEMTIASHTFPAYDLKLPLDPTHPRDLDFWESEERRFTEEQRRRWEAAYAPKNEQFLQDHPTGEALVRYKYQRYIKDYLRCVDSVDENIGRLLDYLDKNNLTENTMVVYTSDQGFFLGEHGWFDKRFMYEESLRMPLVIRYPAVIKAGSVDSHLIQNLDYAPTFLDLAGIKIPAEMQGRSFKKILYGNTAADGRTSIYYHYYEYPAWHMVKKHYGIRTDRYKLIHFYYDIDAWELYDLLKDPREMQNVYDDPEYGEVIEKLKKELQELRAFYGDTKLDIPANLKSSAG